MKKVFATALISATFSAGITSNAMAQDLPPADAKAGECYAKVLVPATYQTTPQTVEIHPALKTVKKIPAVYKDVEKRVKIEDASHDLVIIPGTYETISETVLVQPERIVKTTIPATYRTETTQVEVSPSRVIWKVGRGAHEKVDAATGEIMCRVEIPAKFETVSKQVLATPVQTKEDVVPAKYITVERRMLKTPPTTTKKVIPAKYKTITVKELVSPESFSESIVPAKFSTLNRRKVVSEQATQWRQIMCETNTTPAFVQRLQTALVNAGYSIGTQPNGNYGPATKAAILKYQQANALPTGGLTISTVKKLGL
ncbi:MAG: peptidoglycan-binding protein [Nitratireductor sp.]